MEVKSHDKQGQIPPRSAEIVELPRRGGGGTIAEELSKLPRNDYGNSQRLIKHFGDDLMYVPNVGWYAWTGTHWSLDRGEEIAHLRAQALGEKIKDEVVVIKNAGPWKGEADKDFEKRVQAHAGWASASGNSTKIKFMLIEAAVQLVVPIEDLDKDPMLFNCQDCTLVLRARSEGGVKSRRHDRKDRITKVSPVKYDPNARSNVFDLFMESIIPDEEVRYFLMRWFGYSLTGKTGAQCMAFFYGTGANGKSTLMDLMSYIHGSYSITLPVTSFQHDDHKSGGQATPDLAMLPNIRLLLSSEPDTGFRFSEGLIKTLTGGEEMMVRHLHQGYVSFRPDFKLTMAGNHKPIIRGQDDGIWRRILLVLFNQHIPLEKRDADLPQKLAVESSGVLNWMLDGLMSWLDGGLRPPEAVMAATEEYRMENDQVGQFLKYCTEADEGSDVTATLLKLTYDKWCKVNSLDPFNNNLFGRKLGDKGLKKRKSGITYYLGIKMTQTPETLTEKTGEDYPEDDNL